MDFHALRHTFGTWLVLRGVSLAIVGKLMRHADVRLTIDTYAHLVASDLRSGVEVLSATPVTRSRSHRRGRRSVESAKELA